MLTRCSCHYFGMPLGFPHFRECGPRFQTKIGNYQGKFYEFHSWSSLMVPILQRNNLFELLAKKWEVAFRRSYHEVSYLVHSPQNQCMLSLSRLFVKILRFQIGHFVKMQMSHARLNCAVTLCVSLAKWRIEIDDLVEIQNGRSNGETITY